uniref:Uncharacterized protein n=1 Tax=Salix viminalis TaxID=40686 RepID=A0A6N2LHW6_SALVM
MPLDCPLSKVYTLVRPALISHCCRIVRRTLLSILSMSMHADSHIDMSMQVVNCASSVFSSSLGLSHRPNLSSAHTVDFIDTADFIDVAELISVVGFDTVSLFTQHYFSSAFPSRI